MKRILYWIYLFNWYDYHRGATFKGCKPACYAEWQDCELQDMLQHPRWYNHCWYYFILKSLMPPKESKKIRMVSSEPLIIDKDFWSKREWKTILKLFELESAETITLREYVMETYGVPKE